MPGLEEAFWGQPAIDALSELLRSKPPKDHAEILEATTKEQQKQWLGPSLSAGGMNAKFGKGRWRFIPRFLLWQRLKARLIDDAKRGGQNELSKGEETIFTISVDWLGECLSAFIMAIAAAHGKLGRDALTQEVLGTLPEWFEPLLGLDDLPDAYRGCPVRNEDRRGCIVAFWDEPRQAWRFAESRALLFGLGAAVQAFNRLPTLVVATSRRLLGVCAGAYFDDIAVVGCASSKGSEQAALHTLLIALGSPAAPEKRAWMAQNRQWLGTVCNLAEITSTGYLYMKAKESAVIQVTDGLDKALQIGELPKAPAAKIRGTVGWTGSLAAGKCGRIGIEVLKRKQYQGPPRLDAFDVEALIFLRLVTTLMPERRILVAGARHPPVIIYSDASSGEDAGPVPRMGWVIFDEPSTPKGRAADIPQDVVDSWLPRKTPIFPAEAFAVYAAISEHIDQLQGRDVVVFVDSEAAAASLIRGSSSSDDVGVMAQAVHWLLMRIDCRIWIEWIDSDSNPSDGLSRLGIHDPWTIEQGWQLQQGLVPPWHFGLAEHIEQCRLTLGLD